MTSCLLLACPPWICAVPSDQVQRMLAPREAPEPRAGCLHLEQERYATADLGQLLGTAPGHGGWLLLAAEASRGRPPIALRIAQHLTVARLSLQHRAEPRFFAARSQAVVGGCSLPPGLPGADAGAQGLGLWLDLTQLWSPAELQTLAATRAAA